MRAARFASAVSLAIVTAASSASADGPWLDRFDLDTGRVAWKPLEEGVIRLEMHGEYQLRGVLTSDVPLAAPLSQPDATTLGRKKYLQHWHRFELHAQVSDKVELVGQIDMPRGVVGDTTRRVNQAAEPYDEQNPARIDPRWLYVDVWTPVGLLRVGHQPNHFGMGLLANDGNHPSLFGDYSRGDVSERVLFATKPLGKHSSWAVFLAGDVVFRDSNASLSDGDRALQGLVGTRVGDEHDQVGAFFAVRDQRRDKDTDQPQPGTYREYLKIRAIDVNGRFHRRARGVSGFFFGEAEAAGIWGTTNLLRTVEEAKSATPEKLRTFGAAARLGFAHEPKGYVDRYADLTAAVSWGYATGDADPYDGTTRRFVMNPNFNVGLVLFDHVLAWKSARAATAASDPLLLNRAPPGVDRLPTNGGIAGATYVNPTIVYRPVRTLDLKAGVLFASATADVVDPYQVAVRGRYVNADGGPARNRDLGVELDGGVEWRIPLDFGMGAQLGAQAGVLFPGKALEDANGKRPGAQHVSMLRFGFQY